MSVSSEKKPLTVALIGNPNTGKSTLFNAMSGVSQKTGNYPGCTVERKHGTFKHLDQTIELIDLPGTYSLAPHSPDEMIAVDILLGREKNSPSLDAVIVIVDASNLDRNFYLLSQVLELDTPCVVALNMGDIARSKGITFDKEKISERLGVPLVEIQANKESGIEELLSTLVSLKEETQQEYPSPFPEAFTKEVQQLKTEFEQQRVILPKFLVERSLLDATGYLETSLNQLDEKLYPRIVETRQKLIDQGMAIPAIEAMARYGWVQQTLDGVVTRKSETKLPFTDRLDYYLTNRWTGSLCFVLIMLLMFQSIFSDYTAKIIMDWIEAGFEYLSGVVTHFMPEGPLQSLIVDGVLAGVGGVVVFLPQICILFLFIAILEDCGYMARAAYLMDKIFSKIGLSGKSFIPLLSSFACAIPGVMATRVIENKRDRLITILVAPLMSCSARLPVYTLMIAVFVPKYYVLGGLLNTHSLTMFAMYLLGVITAVLVALILKTTILKGPTPPFVMELPPLKIPSVKTVVLRVVDRGWAFLKRAGTLIFAASIVIWAVSYYPRNEAEVVAKYQAEIETLEQQLARVPGSERTEKNKDYQQNKERLEKIEQSIDGELLRNSFLGQAGQIVEPIVKPLGWDWRIGCAAIASFPAREVIISTLGVIYDLGGDVDEESPSLKDQLAASTWDGTDKKVYTLPVALSIMVFFALCAQCAATLAVIKRETNSWGWPIFTFVYMTTLAYFGALITYQVGNLLLG